MKKTIIISILLIIALASFASAETVYQENANVSSFSGNPWAYGGTPIVDGNWDTYDYIATEGIAGIEMTYYKPLDVVNATWQVKDHWILEETRNFIIPLECWNASPDYLLLRGESAKDAEMGSYSIKWLCSDGSTWMELANRGGGNSNYSKIYEEGIYWNISESPPECINDTDCGSCQYCNSGICENQTHTDNKEECLFCEWCDGSGSCEYQEENQDIKNYCTYGNPIGTCGVPDYWTPESGCNTTWTASCRDEDQIVIANGSCDGYGSCTENYPPVENGTICVDGESVLPSLTYHCGIWYDCQESQISATEYYIGYQNTSEDPSPCSDNNWQPSGNTWTAPTGYRISITEHAENCSVEAVHSGTGGVPNTPRAEVTAPTVAVASAPSISKDALAKGAIILVGGLSVAYAAGIIGKGGSMLRLRSKRRRKR